MGADWYAEGWGLCTLASTERMRREGAGTVANSSLTSPTPVQDEEGLARKREVLKEVADLFEEGALDAPK